MPAAKILSGDVEHLDDQTRWAKLAVGEDVVVGQMLYERLSMIETTSSL
jgi:hypothetical protein